MKKIKAGLLISLFYLLSYVPALAHVKWFVEEEEIEEIPWYKFLDTPVIVWSLIVIAVVVLGWYLNRKVKTPNRLIKFNETYAVQIHRGAQMLLGIFLLVTVDFFWSTIVTPHVSMNSPVRLVITLIQYIIGMMFLFGLSKRIASGALMLLVLMLGYWSGVVVFAENLLLFSLALYFFIKSFKPDVLPAWVDAHSLDILRIGSGVCLIVLAFTEKLLFPELSLAFLASHPWNFMQPIFPGFTDSLFVLSVGMSELIFGLLFTFGYLTRITTIALSVFLLTSATAMFVSVGDWEPGHVVIYAVAVLFLFFGSDTKPTKKD
ncbi:MAG: hypothetical protein KBC12_00700 [Candidatus Pacebacteria bacterium]|nr:hypothetical protein [Candidatus Paceibacterota bacterium]MBP9851166.1 hypothetical protein [Candidatus Paceibacterota bacterium]